MADGKQTGFSSGGHLAVLLGTSKDDSYLEGKGDYLDYSNRVQAVVDHFGPIDFVRVKNTDHMSRPFKLDAEISPTIDETKRLTIEWLQKWLGEPELDRFRIPSRKISPGIQSLKKIHLYFRLTAELPGKTKKNNCKGRFLVRGGGEILAQGKIEMNDLSSEEKRMFYQEFVITGVEMTDEDIMWNFQGEIFDSELDKKYEPSLEGIGYYFHINEDKTVDIDKKVYRKKNRPFDMRFQFFLFKYCIKVVRL
jgi:hypothetical protein